MTTSMLAHERRELKLFSDACDRRDKIQIFADIIAVCVEPSRITKILRFANVQYNIFHEAIELLTRVGFIEETPLEYPDGRVKHEFTATDLGIAWCYSVRSVYVTLNKRGILT